MSLISVRNETWDDYQISKVQKDLNFEVDFRVNDVIGTTVTKWNVILFG